MSNLRCATPRRPVAGFFSATISAPDNIDLLVSHQANRRIILSAAEKLGAEEKVVINIERFGNTHATIPLALSDAVDDKRSSAAISC